MSSISDWFDRNIPGGLDKYLVGIQRDIEGEQSPDKISKLKMDFVKLVESILTQLPQHQESSGQNIKIIISEAGTEDEEVHQTTTPSD